MAATPNDGHYSPLSDAGARSMKLRHFSPERRERGKRRERGEGGNERGEEERDVKRKRGEERKVKWAGNEAEREVRKGSEGRKEGREDEVINEKEKKK